MNFWILIFLTIGSLDGYSKSNKIPIVSCETSIVRGQDPHIRCEKISVERASAKGFALIAHNMKLERYRLGLESDGCFREEIKDRLYIRIYSVCHTPDQDFFRIYSTNIPRDRRAVVYTRGLHLPWYEEEAGIYLYKKFLFPKTEYRRWLIPKKD